MSLPLLLLLSILVLLPKLLSPLPPQSSHLSPPPLLHIILQSQPCMSLFSPCSNWGWSNVPYFANANRCPYPHISTCIFAPIMHISHHICLTHAQNFPIIFLQSSGLSTPTSPFPASVFHFPNIAATHRSLPAAANTHPI